MPENFDSTNAATDIKHTNYITSVPNSLSSTSNGEISGEEELPKETNKPNNQIEKRSGKDVLALIINLEPDIVKQILSKNNKKQIKDIYNSNVGELSEEELINAVLSKSSLLKQENNNINLLESLQIKLEQRMNKK